MRAIKIVIPSVIVLGGLLFCTSSVYGTPEFAKKEKKSCTTCHAKVSGDKAEMVKNLNATGTCYKEQHSMATCAAPKK